MSNVREALSPGFCAVLHVGLYAPRFGSPTRELLLNPAAGTAVRYAIARHLPRAMWKGRALHVHLKSILGIVNVPCPPRAMPGRRRRPDAR
jgi:hypothetical protein